MALADAFFVIGMRKALAPGGALDGTKPPQGLPAEWTPHVRAAVVEEIAAQRSAITAGLAGRLTEAFTRSELRAGATLTGAPEGRAMLERIAAGAERPNVAEQDFLRRWSTQPGATAFARKLKRLKPATLIDPEALQAELAPGIFRRLSERLAGETTKTTAGT